MAVRGRCAAARCARCTLRCDLCMCAELPSIVNRTPVIVVMHVTERDRPSGTAQLLRRCLTDYTSCVVGERGAPFRGLPATAADAPPYLLYPDPSGFVLCPESRARLPERISLVVPDGTWSQARRLFHRNASLHCLPRIALSAVAPSRYALRRNQRPGGLCTAEAVAVALGLLEEPSHEARLRGLVEEFSQRALQARRGEWRPAARDAGSTRMTGV